MSTKKLESRLHRSRQKVPFQRREHLHDGLRMMVADIPREHGWLIQRTTTNVLMKEADEREAALYDAHAYAHRTGLVLAKFKEAMMKEYEQRGEGLTFEEFVDTNHSFAGVQYRDKAESMMIAMGKLQEVTADCVSTNLSLNQEIAELKSEFEDSAMHCRRLTSEELTSLDVRVAMELDGADHTSVIVPFRTAEELSQSRWSPNFESDGRLETYVNNGCFAFVGISCDVHAIQIAGSLTLLHNPCLPPRLGPGTVRLGKCLRILFLADNNLGAHNLLYILKGMRQSKDLEIFHCHSNSIGELVEGSSQQNPDQDPTDSLSAMQDLSEIFGAQSCPLRVVGLSKNNIGAAGLSQLMRGLAINTSITVLDLSENNLGVSGANHIAKCLVMNKSLQTLNVNNTMLTHYGIKAICSALKFNSTLRILFALKNIGPAARQEIFKSMEENTTLEVMHLFIDTPWINPNYLGQESAKEMARFGEVPGGIPFANRVALLRVFKTFDQIAFADQKTINAVDGMKVSISSAIYQHFHPPPSRGPSSRGRGQEVCAQERSRQGGREAHDTVTTEAALNLLESKGYLKEDDDPWNVAGCLDEGPACVWEPVPTECFRLNFSERKSPTGETEIVSDSIPSPDRYTPDRLSTAGSVCTRTPGTPDKMSSEDFARAPSDGSNRSFSRTGSGVSHTDSKSSGKPSGASQVEERLRANEAKRKSTKGVDVMWANVAMKPVDRSAKPVAQHWGPPRQIGVNEITSVQIVGLGVKKNVVNKSHLRCSFCAEVGAAGRAGVGEYGHEDYECPVNFFQTFGVPLPGFTEHGFKDPDLWELGEMEAKPEVRTMWDRLAQNKDIMKVLSDMGAKGLFSEPAEGLPILQRKVQLYDVSRAGVTRKRWDERGSFVSKDAALRKEMFESTKRSSEAFFTFGQDKFDAFLRERSKSGLSGNEGESDFHLPDPDELSIEMRSRLGLTAGGRDLSTRKNVHMADHGGIKFIPSAHVRRDLFLQKIRHNSFDDVKTFIEGAYGMIDVNSKDSKTGATALIEAAQAGSKRITRLLIKSKALVNTQDRKGNTALHYAAAYHYQAIVTYLQQHGADDSIINSKGKSGLEGI